MSFKLYRHHVIKEISIFLDIATFMYNGAFLNYPILDLDDEKEKKEALLALRDVIENLTLSLEQCKEDKISTDDLEISYAIYERRYDEIISKYPALEMFKLHDGYTDTI